MGELSLQQIDELLIRRIGVFAEDVQHKLDLVVEGQQMIVERVDRLEVELKADIARVDQRVTLVHAELSQKIDGVEQKLTKRIDEVEDRLTRRLDSVEQNLQAVAVDLAAHRRDTEAHAVYRVGE